MEDLGHEFARTRRGRLTPGEKPLRPDRAPTSGRRQGEAPDSHAIELSEKIVLLRNGEQHFRAAAAKVTRP